MPTMANITVKKADGTTDVVYTNLASSSGDKTPARWGNLTVGTTPAQRPQFTLMTEPSGNGSSRRCHIAYRWPKAFQDASGNVIVKGGGDFRGTFTVPQDFTQVEINEMAYQLGNLMGSSLVKASFAEGYAPR